MRSGRGGVCSSEGESWVIEHGDIAKHVKCRRPEGRPFTRSQAAHVHSRAASLRSCMHIFVEVLQQCASSGVLCQQRSPRPSRHVAPEKPPQSHQLCGIAGRCQDALFRNRSPRLDQVPSTSSEEPNTPLNRRNFSVNNSSTRRSASLRSFRKLITTTSCFWP